RLLAVPARDPGGGRLAAWRASAHAVEHVERVAETAVREDDPEGRAAHAGERVDLAELAAPQRAGLLDQAVALALPAQQVEGGEVVEVEDRRGHGMVAAARAGDLARQLLLEHAAAGDAGERIGEAERLHAGAQARVLDRDGGLGGEQPEHAG